MSFQWGYRTDNGPKKWSEHFPFAGGQHQSPVDILPSQAVFDNGLAQRPLNVHYIPANTKTIANNGHTVVVNVDGTGSVLEGGPLTNKYQLEQFHFHWGSSNGHGSEHLVEGRAFEAELHLVHWNSEKFASFAEAAKSPEGLTVLGVFIQCKEENVNFKKLVDLLASIKYSNESIEILGGFDPASLLPDDLTKYWTYCGSLTTPPCYESVRFIIFKEPIQVSEEQLQIFRSLKTHPFNENAHPEDKGQMMDNYRPVLPLNDRTIHASFRKFFA